MVEITAGLTKYYNCLFGHLFQKVTLNIKKNSKLVQSWLLSKKVKVPMDILCRQLRFKKYGYKNWPIVEVMRWGLISDP